MKTLATVAALLFCLSCASSNDGFIDNEVTNCQAGSDIELQAGFADQSSGDRLERRVTFIVEITNLSQDEIHVRSVQADPGASSRSRFELQGGSREVGKTIAEGDSTIVEIPMTVRLRTMDGSTDITPVDPNPSYGFNAVFDVGVTVRFDDGSAHRCRFRVPASFS